MIAPLSLLLGQPAAADTTLVEPPVMADEVTAAAETGPSNITKKGKGFWQGFHITGGQLTLPFKIRPKAETNSFRLTTDVTVGAFIGLTRRLSTEKDHALIIPMAAGLTFVNINDSNTSLDRSLVEAEVVPGLTWSTGIILQLEQYSLGLMFGKDYASEIGSEWHYHRKMWWSFGIGFAFFH
ncbi:MAG: hypothetical protein EP344_08070 [Bacteroidetes bacterium]|nr:MAG: hypothetical protein EP344_08070 [Bacteroidota bacterium]